MKTWTAHVTITLRRSILDVQGKTVEHALHALHMPTITDVRIGKHIELHVQAPDKDSAQELVQQACSKLLANPVMEDFTVHLIEGVQNGVPA